MSRYGEPPSQMDISWLEGSAEPEKRVYCAVILQAIVDAVSPVSSVVTALDKRQSREWLLNNVTDFNDVCRRAGIEPECVRRKVQEILWRHSRFGTLPHVLQHGNQRRRRPGPRKKQRMEEAHA